VFVQEKVLDLHYANPSPNNRVLDHGYAPLISQSHSDPDSSGEESSQLYYAKKLNLELKVRLLDLTRDKKEGDRISNKILVTIVVCYHNCGNTIY
jgi:hypothetical protein